MPNISKNLTSTDLRPAPKIAAIASANTDMTTRPKARLANRAYQYLTRLMRPLKPNRNRLSVNLPIAQPQIMNAIRLNRIMTSSHCLSMILSKNRFPLFRIMLQRRPASLILQEIGRAKWVSVRFRGRDSDPGFFGSGTPQEEALIPQQLVDAGLGAGTR